ncbi:MAG: flagellar basal body-associated FliL family protein [Deltaproteobacteria bacterium]|jgi:flagellar FliL protein|nr:flagellar basal body-associated FliL family protein [Deltaproteobacteria bacterium]
MSEKKAQEPKKKEAEEAAVDSSASSGSGKKGLMKIVIIAVLAMVVGGAGAFVLLKTVLAPKAEPVEAHQTTEGEPPKPAEEEEPIVAPTKGGSEVGPAAPAAGGHGAPAEGAAAPVDTGPITVEMKPFTTNLNEPSGRRFLKVTIGLEVENQEAADELNKKMSDIQDSVLILLSSQAIEDISTVDGKERLRSQILNRTNGYMTKFKVKKVKYSDFVIQ